jgi:hypothetical protein
MNDIATATMQGWFGRVDPEIIKPYTHTYAKTSQAAMQRLCQTIILICIRRTKMRRRKRTVVEHNLSTAARATPKLPTQNEAAPQVAARACENNGEGGIRTPGEV